MKEPNENATQLKSQIEKAFDDGKPPSVLLHDDNFGSEERLDIGRVFLHRKWQDVSCEAINPVAEGLYAFLTPEAYRYYLPALMICSLDFNASDQIGPCVINSLDPPDTADEHAMRLFEARTRLFTREECATIRSFLEYVLLEHIIPYERSYVPSFGFTEIDNILEYWSNK